MKHWKIHVKFRCLSLLFSSFIKKLVPQTIWISVCLFSSVVPYLEFFNPTHIHYFIIFIHPLIHSPYSYGVLLCWRTIYQVPEIQQWATPDRIHALMNLHLKVERGGGERVEKHRKIVTQIAVNCWFVLSAGNEEIWCRKTSLRKWCFYSDLGDEVGLIRWGRGLQAEAKMWGLKVEGGREYCDGQTVWALQYAEDCFCFWLERSGNLQKYFNQNGVRFAKWWKEIMGPFFVFF